MIMKAVALPVAPISSAVSTSIMIPLPFANRPSLMRTPTQDQLTAIKALLGRKERELRGFDTAIVKLENRLVQLSAQQQALSKELESHRALIAPIRRLAPEILQEIFIRCLPVVHNAVMSARQAPLLLCRVCHDWRQVAYATPHLWASIHIVLPPQYTYDRTPSPYDVITWLSRSKTLPLSISIYCPPHEPSHVDKAKPYLDILTLLGNRWRSFHLSITSFDLVDYFDHFNAVDLPLLETIHVDSTLFLRHNVYDIVDMDTELPMPIARGFLELPKLHSLSLPFDGFIPFQPAAEWKKLTQLGITRPSDGRSYDLDDLVRVLLSTPNLEVCSISCLLTHSPAGPSHTSQKIDLPNLYSLSITYCDPFWSTWILLTALHTPRLRHWEYEVQSPWLMSPFGDNTPEEQFFDAVSAFLSRLVQPLEELELILYSDGVEFRRLLRFLPDLKRLTLKKSAKTSANLWIDPVCSAEIVDNHLASLTPRDGSHHRYKSTDSSQSESDTESDYLLGSTEDSSTMNCLCPKLEVFQCSGEFSESVLLDFLRSRSGLGVYATHVAPLKKACIYSKKPLADGIQKKVQGVLDGSEMLLDLGSALELTLPSLWVPEYGTTRTTTMFW